MISTMARDAIATHEFVPQAILNLPPAFFIEKGISFRSGLDDLNSYQVAELVLDDVPFALLRHEGTPADQTEVYLPDSIPLIDVAAMIRRILNELDLPASAIRWQRRDSATPF